MGRQAKRAAVGQCDTCLVTCTAMVNAAGRITGVDVPATFDRGHWFHKDCAGSFVAFDIAGGGLVDA